MTRLQEETEKQNKSQIELENLQQLLCQLEDRIKTQSDECQEHIGEYRPAVEKVTEFEKVIHIQQKEIDSLLNDLSSEIKLNMELELGMVKLRDLLAIPDIAGQDKANPLAMVLSAVMLLKYGLGEEDAARRIENAVLTTLDKGFRTGDLMSPGKILVGCARIGEEVLKALDSPRPASVLT